MCGSAGHTLVSEELIERLGFTRGSATANLSCLNDDGEKSFCAWQSPSVHATKQSLRCAGFQAGRCGIKTRLWRISTTD